MVAKLQYELEKLVPSEKKKSPQKPELKTIPVLPPKVQAPDSIPQTQPVVRTKVVRNDREIRYDDLPKSLQILWDQNRDDYKMIRSYHEKLKLLEKASDDDRKVLVAEILKMEESIRERWEKIDQYHPSEDAGKLDYKRIQANRKYISKSLSELRNGRSPETIISTLQQRVDELTGAQVNLTDKTIAELRKYGVRF